MLFLKKSVLIAFLFLTCAAIFAQDPQTKRLGKIAITDENPKPRFSENDMIIQESLIPLIPASDEIKDWKIKDKTRFFAKDNLWEYIDGAAEHYIFYGFRQIAATEYHSAKDTSITLTLDIYDMGNLENAFGAYSTERPQEGNFVRIGVQGFSDELSTVFFKDRYLIKIFVFDVNPELAKAMKDFAEAVAQKIPGTLNFPIELKKLPEKDKIQNSEQYIVQGILGEEGLRKGFIAAYKAAEGKPNYSLFYLTLSSPQEAASVYAKIKESHAVKNHAMREVDGIADKCLDILTKFNGRIVIMTKGEKVAGGWFLPMDDLTSLNIIKKMLE